MKPTSPAPTESVFAFAHRSRLLRGGALLTAALAALPLGAAPAPVATSTTSPRAPANAAKTAPDASKPAPAKTVPTRAKPAAAMTPATAKPAAAVKTEPAADNAKAAPAANAPTAKPAVTKPPAAKTPTVKTPAVRPAAKPAAAASPAKLAPPAKGAPASPVKPPAAGLPKIPNPAPASPAKPVAKPLPAPASGPVLPSLRDLAHSEKLSNGLTFVTRQDRTSPRVAFSLLIRAGAADEPVANVGWRRILTEAMLRASKTEGFAPATAAKKVVADALPEALTALQMQRLAEAAGGQIGASVGDDVIEFWAVGDARGAGALLDVLLQVATHPRLSTADIDAARRRVTAAGEASQDDVAQSATAALRAQIYRNASGAPLAYGLAPQGTDASRRALTEDRMRAYFRSYVRPENMVLSAAGSFDSAFLASRLQAVAAPKNDAAASDEPVVRGSIPFFAPIVKTEPTLLVRQLPTADAWIFVSFLGAPSNGNDLPALAVMSALLGEEPGARLPRRLLGTRPPSLGGPPDETAQQAAVSFVPRRFGSEFVLYAQTEAGSVDSVKNALLDEARKLRDTSVPDAELQRAKNYVRGNWAIDREPLRERAFNAGLAATIGAPADIDWPGNVQKVTPADIRRIAQKYLGGYAVALIMPQE